MPHTPSLRRYLVTVQAYVEAPSAVDAENIAIEACDYLEEANEHPTAGPTTIQTCVVHKEPFRPIGDEFTTGNSCEGEIDT